MAPPTKRERIQEAWAEYRADSIALQRRLSYSDYLMADDLLWRRYLDLERAILADKEMP